MKKQTYIILTIFLLTGCASWVESAKKMIGKDEAAVERKDVKWVSKDQYDDLMLKYNNLNEENQKLKIAVESSSQKEVQGYDQVEELSKSVDMSDGIDVFAQENLSKKIEDNKVANVSNTESLVDTYNKALILKNNGKLKTSLGMFQFLEKSNVEQIVVRARFQIAQIYYSQNQFDLSLQVHESIISENSFSAIVLDALKGAIMASKSLGLKDKEARYESVLKDFFGINS